MKTVFDVFDITIRGTSIMYIFFVTVKTGKIITDKEDTGLQSIYNLDKTYLKTFLYSIKEGAVEISQ